MRKEDRFELDVSAVRTDKSDDRFFQVESGLEFPDRLDTVLQTALVVTF